MIQIRIHGRGGQGVVTAAELVAIAAFKGGKEVQAFPYFGVERTGAPIEGYVRIDDKPIRLREQIYRPDFLIIQDSTLIKTVDLKKGVGEKTVVIINAPEAKGKIKLGLPEANVYPVDATKIALEEIGKNIVNAAILGAFAKVTGLITLENLKTAIKEKLKNKDRTIIVKNIRAAEEAYRNV